MSLLMQQHHIPRGAGAEPPAKPSIQDLLEQIRPAPARAHDRQRRGLAESADAGIGHHLAQLHQRDRVARRAPPLREATQDLGLALRTDLAWVTLTAALVREEVADA